MGSVTVAPLRRDIFGPMGRTCGAAFRSRWFAPRRELPSILSQWSRIFPSGNARQMRCEPLWRRLRRSPMKISSALSSLTCSRPWGFDMPLSESWLKGRWNWFGRWPYGENLSYQIQGTPWERVLTQGVPCLYPHGVQDLFPADVFLSAIRAESYYGLPLLDRGGHVLVSWP